MFITCSQFVCDLLGLVHNFFKHTFHNLLKTWSELAHLRTITSWLANCSKLCYDLFTTCEWLVQALLLAHNFLKIFTAYVWLVMDFFTTCSQLVHNLLTNLTTCSWLVHILFTTFLYFFITCSGLAFSFSFLSKYSWA